MIRRLQAMLARDSGGSLLLETIVAAALLAVVGSAVLNGLSTAYRSSARTETQATVENIARNQMELAFSLPYAAPPASYTSLSGLPPGFTSQAVASEFVQDDSNIELVTVTVSRDGTTELIVETLRARE